MELVKDIYFNTDKLVENSTVKVSYTGKFYQINNEKVFIHYGYGKNWNNVNEVEMLKTDLGYQAELDLVGEDTLNFCFKNQNNEWDNNSGKNYIFNIEKPTVNNLGKTTIGINPQGTTGSFFGKTFSTTNNTEASQIENGNVDNNVIVSGVIEDSIIGTPNSIDTVINTNNSGSINNIETADTIGIGSFGTISEPTITNLDNGITQKITYNLGVSAPTTATRWENTKINIINPVANAIKNTANQAVTIAKKTANQVSTATKKYINQDQKPNALTVQPTGFNLWTQKIKTTVGKFFAYVPKLISGNYKRNISENKK